MNTDKLIVLGEKLFKGRIPLIHPNTLELEKEDFIQFQLRWILRNTYPVKKTELVILSYIYLYGIEAIDRIVKEGILTSRKTVENCISKFRKDGIVEGRGKNTKLHKNLSMIDGNNITFIVKVNCNEKVVSE